MKDQVVARLFEMKEFVKAVRHKEETGGLMFRVSHPTYGSMYEVRYLPPIEPKYHKYYKAIAQRKECYKKWPIFIHYWIKH